MNPGDPTRGPLARVAPVIDLTNLARKHVVVVGAGSGGSLVATQLARSGVGTLTLFDAEDFALENVSRHAVGGVSDVGKPKVDLVARAIREINPACHVRAVAQDVAPDDEEFGETVTRSDLLVDATGRASVGHFLSRAASAASKPATFAGVYARGVGGFVLRYRPGTADPCYTCVASHLRMTERANRLTPEAPASYRDATDPDELRAEPSLPASVAFVALLLTRMNLEVLHEGQRSPFTPLPGSLLLWANEPWCALFEKPLSYRHVAARRLPECPSCGSGGALRGPDGAP